MQPRQGRRAATRCHLMAAVLLCVAPGCANFWDEVTSRDFKFKDAFKKAPDPLQVARTSTDGDRKSKALRKLREPLQNGGTQKQQDEVVQLLTTTAATDPQPLCRLAAICSLQNFKDPRAAQGLVDAWERATYFQRERPDAVELIQEQALRGLGVNGNPAGVDLLVRVLKQPPLTGADHDAQSALNQRIAAARALAHFPQYQAAEALVSVLRTEQDVALRNRATESLTEMTGEKLPPDAQAWDDFLRKSGPTALAHKPTLTDKFIKLVSFDP